MIQAWNRFWFAPVSLYSASMFRLIFGFLAAVFYSIRHQDLELFFGDEGLIPLKASRELLGGVYHSPLFWFPTELSTIKLMHLGLIVCLFIIGIGIWTRGFALIALYLHVLFMQRNFALVYGTDKVISFFLFFLILMESDRLFSLRSLLTKTKKFQSTDLLTPVAYRLFQIQICVIYGYSGIEKLKGTTWWTGGALWNLLTNGNQLPFDSTFTAQFPALIAVGTYSILFWEIYFPAVIWNKTLRPYLLIWGTGMHLFIGIFMNLPFFAFMMILSYLFWIDGKDVLRTLGRTLRIPSLSQI